MTQIHYICVGTQLNKDNIELSSIKQIILINCNQMLTLFSTKLLLYACDRYNCDISIKSEAIHFEIIYESVFFQSVNIYIF